jgi:hypothetical protein
MLAAGAEFHTSLVSAGMGIIGFSGVETHKFYGLSQETISFVRYDVNGDYIGVDYSNAGDGTVMAYSAFNSSYANAHSVYQEHMDLVKDQSTINQVGNIIAGISTMSAQEQQIEVNENGWLVGPQFDNRRVSVDIGGTELITIATAGGEPVVEEGDILCKIYSDGSREQVGVSCIMGGGYNKKYYLHNGEYNFFKPVSVSGGTEAVSFRIEYYNDGYLEKSITFENVECYTADLSVKDYYMQEAECFTDGAYEPIAPTSVQIGG